MAVQKGMARGSGGTRGRGGSRQETGCGNVCPQGVLLQRSRYLRRDESTKIMHQMVGRNYANIKQNIFSLPVMEKEVSAYFLHNFFPPEVA